jgi:heptose I phosphotransferase
VYRADWLNYVGAEYLRDVLTVEVTDRFHEKQGRSTGRWVLQHEGRSLIVYLKRHHRLPLWQRLLATIYPSAGWSPAFLEWKNLHWARKNGIPAPEPIAAGEFIGPGLRLESFLAVAELTGMKPLSELIPQAHASMSGDEFRGWKRRLIAEMAEVVRRLHLANRYHKDLYLCHFYLPEADCVPEASVKGRLHLIDLHRLSYHWWTSRRWCIKDLAQLLYSAADIPGFEPTDSVSFLQAYLQRSELTAFDHWFAWMVASKARGYQRQEQRRNGEDEEQRIRRAA